MLSRTIKKLDMRTFFSSGAAAAVLTMVFVTLNPLAPDVLAHETGPPHFHAVPNWLVEFAGAVIGQFVSGLSTLMQIVTYVF